MTPFLIVVIFSSTGGKVNVTPENAIALFLRLMFIPGTLYTATKIIGYCFET
ncbi:hypothetical protein JYQ62_31240 [Nostoc sp. UHCC 0702]|nr:hypothetical protein JYQ62_31240 [Nostoc sp. UHCC 0702]